MPVLRGKVLKVPDATPGLLFVNGQQKPYQIDGIWRSANIAPSVNLTVDVELTESGEVVGISPLSDSDLTKEKLEEGRKLAEEKGRALASSAVDKVGKPILIATALLAVGWFFLDFYSLNIPVFFTAVKIHPTFWQNLGYVKLVADALDNPLQTIAGLSSGHVSTGIYGFFAIISLVAPLLPLVWKDKRAVLGALLPLVFTLLIALQGYRVVEAVKDQSRSALSQADLNPAQIAQIKAEADEQAKQLFKAVHFELGLGFYLSSAATLFLAGAGIRKFLIIKASSEV